jgi:hypothetical protein
LEGGVSLLRIRRSATAKLEAMMTEFGQLREQLAALETAIKGINNNGLKSEHAWEPDTNLPLKSDAELDRLLEKLAAYGDDVNDSIGADHMRLSR